MEEKNKFNIKKSPYKNLSKKEKLFYEIIRIRRIEEEIAKVYSEQEIRCPVHLSIGQEACAVGVCSSLLSSDEVFSGHRNHAHYLAKGGDLRLMISELYGKKTGCCGGKGGSMHLTDINSGFIASTPIVGSTIPIAVGNSLANKLKKNRKITCIFFGDGALETGVFYESLNLAATMELPVIFVCENNLYSVYSPLSVRQPKNRRIELTASSLNIKTKVIEDNNVEKISDEMKIVTNEVREREQPYFVLINTYRYKEHCGPGEDNFLKYRSNSEINFWKKLDPIKVIQKEISEDIILKIENNIQDEILDAFNYAKKSPFPSERDASKNLFTF